MVSIASIICMVFSLLLSIGVPLGLIIFLKKKYKVSLKVVFVGMIAFFIATQVLESSLHLYFLKVNVTTAKFLTNPIAFMLYGGLMAGIFEETARLVCYKFIIKKNRSFIDGITYGVGHGGIEAMLIGGIASISYIVKAISINSGQTSSVYSQIISTPALTWSAVGIERLFALCIQISLSIIVLYAVKERKYIYYLIAILLHAIIDSPAALYQLGTIKNIWIIELIVGLEAIALLAFAFKVMKKKFYIKEF